VSQRVIEVGGGWMRGVCYEFGKVGRVWHLVPSVGGKEGVDEMFTKYQTQDVPFRRYRMMNGKSSVLKLFVALLG
jgi:hypothetical protein